MPPFCCPCFSPSSPKETKDKKSKKNNVEGQENDSDDKLTGDRNQFSAISGVMSRYLRTIYSINHNICV